VGDAPAVLSFRQHTAAQRMQVLETARLIVRHFERADAPFIMELLNEPSWVQFIGDKGIKTIGDAERYIQNVLVAMYARFDFGLYLVQLKASGEALGMCGLVKRDSLEDVDLGFAFLPRFWGHGYAYESSAAVMSHAKLRFGLHRLVAITLPTNQAASALLQKLGFNYERMFTATASGEDLMLYSIALPGSEASA
jgi:RimJ/RimL family protein N-acetyltransferase